MTPTYIYRASLHRIIDGDTFELTVDLGFSVSSRVRVRLRGLFTAEANTTVGQIAKARAQQIFSAATEIVLATTKTKTGTDVLSFNRYVADVWIDGRPLAELLQTGPPAGVGARTMFVVEVFT